MATNGINSIATDLMARLPGSPDVYPQKFDLVAQTLLLVQLDAAAYRAASFLDDRILAPGMTGGWVPLGTAIAVSRGITETRPLHFIFHTGHVGSTLVSRLLDETAEVLSLREPLPLRMLADAHDVLGQVDSLLSTAQFDVLMATFLQLWSRGYGWTRAIVVKATSSAGRMAPPILERVERARAIYMNLRAEPYLATLLAGKNSPTDLRGHARERIRRLRSRIAASVAPLHSMSIGELAALSWLSETLAQRDALARFADRVMAVDFDDFLSNVAAGMQRVLAHFDLAEGSRRLSDIARSQVLTRYSKAPEYPYTPSVRAEILGDSRRQNREEIRKGMQWLERQARSDAAVAAIFASAAA